LYYTKGFYDYNIKIGSFEIAIQDCTTQLDLVRSGETTLKGKGKLLYSMKLNPFAYR
jgi:hypothetical protein